MAKCDKEKRQQKIFAVLGYSLFFSNKDEANDFADSLQISRSQVYEIVPPESGLKRNDT